MCNHLAVPDEQSRQRKTVTRSAVIREPALEKAACFGGDEAGDDGCAGCVGVFGDVEFLEDLVASVVVVVDVGDEFSFGVTRHGDLLWARSGERVGNWYRPERPSHATRGEPRE